MKATGLLGLFSGCILAACQTDGATPNAYETAFPPASYSEFRDLTPAEKTLLASGLREKLKDPESAQFRWTKITKSAGADGRVYYCGAVNAKNSYGGFTGFGPFWAWVYASPKGQLLRAEMIGTGADDLANRVIGEECGKRGIAISTAS
jgi:hypothetical protein